LLGSAMDPCDWLYMQVIDLLWSVDHGDNPQLQERGMKSQSCLKIGTTAGPDQKLILTSKKGIRTHC
jgi:hypothetical protein